ncbi:MAG: hypothetical protein ACTSRA_05145 [Promethearchaeota archaeon]
MLDLLLDHIPFLIFFLIGVFCLVINFRSNQTFHLFIFIQVITVIILILQLLFEPEGDYGNFAFGGNTLLVIIIILTYSTIIIYSSRDDHKILNVKRFSYMLYFFIEGSLIAVAYSNNLLVLGVFILLAMIFLTISRFIQHSGEKRTIGTLFIISFTGYVLYMVGIYLALKENNYNSLLLNDLEYIEISQETLIFILLGLSFFTCIFPIGYILMRNFFQGSNFSIQLFFLLFYIIITWKFATFILSLAELTRTLGIFVTLSFILAVVCMIFGMANSIRILIKRYEKNLNHLIINFLLVDIGIINAFISVIGESKFHLDKIDENTILGAMLLQMLVLLASKSILLMSVKNIKKIFDTDILDNMGGIKLRNPITTIGFLFGSLGNVYLGIYTLDGLYSIGFTLITVCLFFWFFTCVTLYSTIWTGLTFSWIFLGSKVPIQVTRNIHLNLKKEDTSMVIMIACVAFLLIMMMVIPSANLLAYMIPA